MTRRQPLVFRLHRHMWVTVYRDLTSTSSVFSSTFTEAIDKALYPYRWRR